MDPEIEEALSSYTAQQRASLVQVGESVRELKAQKTSLEKEACEVEAKTRATRDAAEELQAVRELLQEQCQRILGIELCFAESIQLSPAGAHAAGSDMEPQFLGHDGDLLSFKEASQRLQDSLKRAQVELQAASARLKRAQRALAVAEEELRNARAAVDELRRRLADAGAKALELESGGPVEVVRGLALHVDDELVVGVVERPGPAGSQEREFELRGLLPGVAVARLTTGVVGITSEECFAISVNFGAEHRSLSQEFRHGRFHNAQLEAAGIVQALRHLSAAQRNVLFRHHLRLTKLQEQEAQSRRKTASSLAEAVRLEKDMGLLEDEYRKLTGQMPRPRTAPAREIDDELDEELTWPSPEEEDSLSFEEARWRLRKMIDHGVKKGNLERRRADAAATHLRVRREEFDHISSAVEGPRAKAARTTQLELFIGGPPHFLGSDAIEASNSRSPYMADAGLGNGEAPQWDVKVDNEKIVRAELTPRSEGREGAHGGLSTAVLSSGNGRGGTLELHGVSPGVAVVSVCARRPDGSQGDPEQQSTYIVNVSHGTVLDQVRAQFRRCDPAQTGSVERTALAQVLRSIGNAGYWTDARVDKLLEAADRHGCTKHGVDNGAVEYDKFLRWMFTKGGA